MKRPRKLFVYRDTAGEWRYRVVAGNGRVVAAAEEGFTRGYAIEKGRAAAGDHRIEIIED